MPNGAEHRIYSDALTAQLGERVTNPGRRQSDLEGEMRSGFKQIESSTAAMSSEMRSSVAALLLRGASLSGIAVALSSCPIVGGPVDWPIQSATTDLKGSITIITEKMVTQKEMEWRTNRGSEDRARTEAALKKLRDAQVPREALDRAWANYDQRLQDQQHQIDEVKTAQGSVYGQRDIILDLRERLDRVERQRIASPSG
ncbi:hypothetical protein NOJ28_26575 [Neorhizobium galegae]|uniref:hypothetical protein n=1 Tax=Neorhizobium galegae TaxID=399 RepID=UPI002104BE0E|nr:hypothetical protein [Neorhizobium galegae]MCQ1769099.1 hypothetical protein [Neorhizobium galegae]MCQ1846264.1 hypothetical protein [Neorhizobium galegae]